MVLYLFVVAYDRRVGVGVFVLPVILVLVSVAYVVSDTPSAAVRSGVESAEKEALRGWLMLHASLLSLGITGVVAGIVLSLMYLVQHRRLRHKQARPSGMTLFSLERLARWNRLSVLAAVPLLSLGLAVGFLLGFLADRQGGRVSLWDPVVVASCVAWVVAVAVLGRSMRSDETAGRAVAVRTLLGFGFLLATMLGLQLVTGGGGHGVEGWQTGQPAEHLGAGKAEVAR